MWSPTWSSSGQAAADSRRHCSAAGSATRWCCWRRHRSSAAPRGRQPSGTGCPTTSRCALGLADEEPDFLRYVARLARPTAYDPTSPTLGLSQWEYDMCRAIYASASPAAEPLAEKGALEYRHCPDVVDYWSELPEDKAPTGRVLVPRDARDTMSDGGAVGTASMAAAAERDGVDIRVSHRVQRLVVSDGAVVGVEATTPAGRTHRIAARKAVIFATGGF